MKKQLLKKLNLLSKFLFVLFCNTINSQNLVPNPSFEMYSSCPDGSSQIPLATGWSAPTDNSSDYYNVCATDLTFSVPNQDDYNFQMAKNGNAYAGIFTYNGPGMNYREYLQVQLISLLNSFECYYIEFYINLSADLKYAVNNLGLHFSNNAINATGTGYVLNLEPHVLKLNNPIISDTMNWVKISGVYQASGGEQYITIGNFKNDVNTNTLNVDNNGYFGSYYYIDDVSVIAVSDLPNSMPAYAGEDVSVTLGDSIFIGQEISNLNCTWRLLDGTFIADSTSGIWVQPTEASTYVVEQNLCGTITYDTVTVFTHGVGLNEISTTETHVFPNPSAGKIFVISNGELNMQLLDMMGKSVKHTVSKLSDTVYEIECSCENGLYQLILNENEKTIVKKIEFIK